MSDRPAGGTTGRRGHPLALVATIAALLVAGGLGGLIAVSLSAPRAAAADVSITLYGTYVGGWSLTPGGETNPGPTIRVNPGDIVTVHMISEDAPAEHGLFIDFDDSGLINSPPDYSSPTGVDRTFTFTVPSLPGTHYYYCSIHSGVLDIYGDITYSPGNPMSGAFIVNRRPSATFAAPTGSTSWTAGSAHDITFNLVDDDPLAGLTVWVNYSHTGGTQGGTIAGPAPGMANPNVVPWTPTGFSATDVVINVTAVDSRGLAGSTRSAAFDVDSTAPTITSRSPDTNAIDVTRNTRVRVTWSEGMDTTATGASTAFGVRRILDGAWISASTSWSPDGTVMTLTPSTIWAATTTFEVHVNATAEDDSDPGNALAGPSAWQFTTGTVTDANPPVIAMASASPATQESGSPVTIQADVTDDDAVAAVNAHVQGPSTDVNLTMAPAVGTTWTAAQAYTAAGLYAFTVWAVDLSGNAASRSGSFTIAAPPPPPAPSGVTTHVQTDGTIMVIWSPATSGNITGYNVWRSTAADGPFTKLTSSPILATDPLQYVDANALLGVTYYYAVTAVDGSGNESPRSTAASGTLPGPAPAGSDYTPWIVLAFVATGVVLAAVLFLRRRKP